MRSKIRKQEKKPPGLTMEASPRTGLLVGLPLVLTADRVWLVGLSGSGVTADLAE